jgi:hypothetical protein
MATVPRQKRAREIEYPSGDVKPVAETEIHLEEMIDTIQVLRDYFADQPDLHAGGGRALETGNRGIAPRLTGPIPPTASQL